MSNLSLTSAELERLLKVFAYTLAIVWAVLFCTQVFGFEASVASGLWRGFGTALTISVFLFGWFYRSGWKYEWVARFMVRPVVLGVWKGELRSDYQRGENDPLIVPIVFVIRQTYLSLSVESFTRSQEGESQIEALHRNSKTEATRLCYVFELRHLFPGENSLVNGAGELKLAGDQKTLSGNYWTSTPTHGRIVLELLSRDFSGISSFEDARRKFFATEA